MAHQNNTRHLYHVFFKKAKQWKVYVMQISLISSYMKQHSSNEVLYVYYFKHSETGLSTQKLEMGPLFSSHRSRGVAFTEAANRPTGRRPSCPWLR